MSSFNNKILAIKNANYNTPPQNLPQFQNPFLLLSKNEAYNNWSKTMKDKKKQKNNGNTDKVQAKTAISKKKKLNLKDEEDLARHAMKEVYESAENRRDIAGYTLDSSLSTPEHLVYSNGKTVLFGLRGSSSIKDFVADSEIGLKSFTGWPDSLSETLLNRYKRDEDIYQKIRQKYPNQHITMSGHSLGNTLGMNILKNHPDDKNIKFFGYNGWIHPDYNKDKRAFSTRQEGDLVSTFTPSNKSIGSSTGAIATGAIIGGGAYATINARKTNIKKLADLQDEITRLQNRRDVGLAGQTVDEPASMRAEVADAFPEYTNVASIIENAPDGSVIKGYQNVLEEGHPEMFIKTNDVGIFETFLIDNGFKENVENYNFDDLIDAVSDFNANINLTNHPELTDATEASQLGNLDREEFFHNVYVTDGDDGIDELMDYRNQPNFDAALRPESHTGIMDQSRITTSEILDDEGTINLHTFADVTEGISNEEEATMISSLETLAAEAGVAITSAGIATALLGVVGVVGASYYLYSHSAKRFKIKNNKFKNKKSN